jgi:hypothetical protein
LAILYDLSKNYKTASEYYNKHISLKDSLQLQDISNKINQIGLEFEFAKQLKQKEFEHLQKQHANEIELNKQKFFNYIIGISLLLFIIISIIIYKAFKDKKNANEIILQQKIALENQHQVLKGVLSDITDSVKYAQRIQNSILPTKEYLRQLFGKIEIIFKPKDIVSGDFYWATEKNDKKIMVLADCTGHGVPGAFMSILGFNALNKIVIEENITEPNLILTELDKYITQTLKQNVSDTIIRDGMDISIVTFIDNYKIKVAGANNGIWIYRKTKQFKYRLIPIAPDKLSIGYTKINQRKIFSVKEIDLQPGDLIVLYTDGFADQFGGPKNKKMKVKLLKEKLLSYADLPVEDIKEKLEQFFIDWKGDKEQIDDVSLIFIKV